MIWVLLSIQSEETLIQEDPKIRVLMAVFRGAPFLRAQLDSIAGQKEVNWALTVSNDGLDRDDGSELILAEFQRQNDCREIKLCAGPRLGFAANFLSMLRDAPESEPYVALCDQDDVWFADKLSRAIKLIRRSADLERPVLYCSRTMVTDENLREIGLSPLFRHAPAFENALVQSIGGGNTMVLNAAAMNIVRQAAAEVLNQKKEIVAHDWWLYQIVSGCGGTVVRDECPSLLYRQHGRNLIGANRSLLSKLSRIAAFLTGRFRGWNRINVSALSVSEHLFTEQARRTFVHYQEAMDGSLWHRIVSLRSAGVWRQSRAGTVALYCACLLGRL